MPTINQLPLVTQVSGGNQVVLWVSDQGDSRRASITTLIEYIEANFGNVVCTTVRTTASTVAQLPNAVGNAGARGYVTDSTVSTFGTTVVGGGANQVPVYSDGTNWKVG